VSPPLVTGANRPVSGPRVGIDASCLPAGFAFAAIPLGSVPDAPFQGALGGSVAYLSDEGRNRYAIDLGRIGSGTERVELVAYAVRGGRQLREVGAPTFSVDNSAIVPPPESGRYAALVFARLYRHGGGWKLRALAEGSNHGLTDLGRLLGRSLDQSGPAAAPPPGLPSAGPGPGQPQTGTGFLVAPRLLLTNAHVVQHAREIRVSGFDGRCEGEPVVVDDNCDLALVRVPEGFGGEPLAFRTGPGVELGEAAIALGYPLAGLLGSGAQVAHGSVSGLLGPGEDSRVIQITTPIQGGSSGGPVFDLKGRVIGVVTATLSGAQNVNFAIRACLGQALVEAAGKAVALAGPGPDLDIATVARQARGAVWRLEARQ